MHRRTLSSFLGLALVASLSLTSCSNKATEEQMKTLRELDQNRDRLQSELDRSKNTLRDLQSKLDAQNRDLADCARQTAAVREGLALWPNVWPDANEWNPPPPPAPAPVTGKKMKKK